MELVHVAGVYPPHLGGVEVVAERLAVLLSESHRVSMYTSDLGARGSVHTELHGGRRGGSLRVVRHRTVRLLNTPVTPGLLTRLLLHRPRPDVVHMHTGRAMIPEAVRLACALRRLRYVAHFHLMVRPSSPLGHVLLPLYERLFFGPFLRRAARVICLTSAMRESVISAFHVDPARAVVIANGVDVEPVQRTTVVRRADELLFVGRLTEQKNVGVLLDAMSILDRDVTLRVIGDGDQRDLLLAKVAALGLTTVRFEGRRTAAEVAAAYARATALVMPSTYEGMPLVLLEAMAAGVPVVVSALPEIVEVAGDTVLTVAPVTPDELAEALRRVIDDSALRDQLSQAAQARAGRFTWGTAVDDVVRLYAEVVTS
jgi:glycosyltransferase involved in cell wall biosynthesis